MPAPMTPLSLSLIDEARRFLHGRIRETPVEPSPRLSEVLGAPAWLKLESLQRTGSFKVRGALFRLSRLTEQERRTGIATCSAGNHGKGVAFAARAMGLAARIYVPRSVDESKYRAMRELGGEVIRSEFPGYDDTEAWAREEAARTGRPFISAFDDEAVMAANGGTLAVEVVEQIPEARAFVFPVGGGGLGAGFAFYVKEHLAGARIVGCQHELSPALALSLARGEAVTRLPAVETSAGGVEGGIGARTFGILKERVDRVALVSEEEILDAVRFMLAEHQYLIEPSAAVAVAACRTGKAGGFDAPVVIVLTGRNVDLGTIRRILA
jgi:threonine dehydratase